MERFNCRARDSYEILLDENGWKGFTQSNAKISIFDGSVIETNRELQEAKLIVQKWRFGTSPDGVHLLLVLEEPEPGVTVVKLTHNDNGWKDFMQSNVKISIFVGSIIGTNMELQEAKLIVQKWRFGSWPDGVYSLGKLVLKEPEPGVTVVKLTHNDVLEEDM
ncbi:hypothetical protein Ahy_B03g065897 [Arachis hypogaea]|uniref:Activator of Hsp90 ATPase homologue 1/2-like C-terminal domain-containing protein n=1 Tax=Arachis hypogaea TaxID=3818 RepID=A0A445A2K9_ARAHY|nr:hypothetical protein Ahy_B03g065897 [Arachis hypogaea]